MKERPVFIGEAPGPNTRPDAPLFPFPAGSAGGRLQRHSGLSRGEWLRRTDRINLLPTYPGSTWPRAAARDHAMNLLYSGLLRGRVIVCVGAKVREAFGLTDRAAPFLIYELKLPRVGSWRVSWIWHTSGRSRVWNDPANVRALQEFVAQVLDNEKATI